MWKSLKNRLPDVDREDLLDLIGMESRRSSAEKVLPALALFGAGVAVGVGIGLMLAPRSGSELRGELKSKLGRGEAAPAAAPNGEKPAARPV